MVAEDVETRQMDCSPAVWGKGKRNENAGNPDREKMKRGRRAGIFEASSEKVRV